VRSEVQIFPDPPLSRPARESHAPAGIEARPEGAGMRAFAWSDARVLVTGSTCRIFRPRFARRRRRRARGCSSVGRALGLQPGGHRFEPGQLHHVRRAEKRSEPVSLEKRASRLTSGCSDGFSFFRSLTIWNDPSVETVRSQHVALYFHMPRTSWGYMVKRLSAYGGCLGGRRR
jgi:hypothetical protein